MYNYALKDMHMKNKIFSPKIDRPLHVSLFQCHILASLYTVITRKMAKTVDKCDQVAKQVTKLHIEVRNKRLQ